MESIIEIINAWDPIELFPLAPKDEYFEEVKQIYEYLRSAPEVEDKQLAQKINEIFLERFGNDVYVEDISQCINIAKKIIYSNHLLV